MMVPALRLSLTGIASTCALLLGSCQRDDIKPVNELSEQDLSAIHAAFERLALVGELAGVNLSPEMNVDPPWFHFDGTSFEEAIIAFQVDDEDLGRVEMLPQLLVELSDAPSAAVVRLSEESRIALADAYGLESAGADRGLPWLQLGLSQRAHGLQLVVVRLERHVGSFVEYVAVIESPDGTEAECLGVAVTVLN